METFSNDGDSREGGDGRRKHAAAAPQGEGEDNRTVANNNVKPIRDWTSEDVRDTVKAFQASLLKSMEGIYPAFVAPAAKCGKEGCDDKYVKKGATDSHPNVLDIAQKFPGQISHTINENLVLWRTTMLGLMAGGVLTATWLGHARLLRRWTRAEDIPRQYYATRRRVRVRVMECHNGVIYSEHIPPLLRIVPNFLRPAMAIGSRTLLPLRMLGVHIEVPGEQLIRQNNGRVAQAELLFPDRIGQQPRTSVVVFLTLRLGRRNLWRKVDLGEYLLHQGIASIDEEDYSTTDPYSHNLVKNRTLQLLSQV